MITNENSFNTTDDTKSDPEHQLFTNADFVVYCWWIWAENLNTFRGTTTRCICTTQTILLNILSVAFHLECSLFINQNTPFVNINNEHCAIGINRQNVTYFFFISQKWSNFRIYCDSTNWEQYPERYDKLKLRKFWIFFSSNRWHCVRKDAFQSKNSLLRWLNMLALR